MVIKVKLKINPQPSPDVVGIWRYDDGFNRDIFMTIVKVGEEYRVKDFVIP